MTSFDPQGRTDRLETILQAAEQTQQTGIMNVQRGKGGVSEKGIIYFLHGQAVDATVGERKGVEAWNWLKTWNSCQYVFTSKSPAEIPAPSPSVPEAASSGNKIASPLAFVANMIPRVATHNETKSDSQVADSEIPSQPTEPLPDGVVEQLSFQTPIPPVQAPAAFNTPPALPAFQPPATYRPAGTNNHYKPNPVTPAGPVTPIPPVYRTSGQTSITQRPFRLVQGSEALTYMAKAKLTRQHRHIFFLLDGQRTIDDLTRLTGNHITDTLRLLADLERIGLIKQQ
jgi:hypothetical protein